LWEDNDIALASAGLLATLVAIVGVARAARERSRGQFLDPEIQARGASRLLGMRVRHGFAWAMGPLISLLVVLQVPPAAITAMSLLLSVVAGLCLAHGWVAPAGWAVLASGACDFLDGRVARKTRQESKAGAGLDSVLDRYGEAAVLLGLAWLARSSQLLLPLVLATLVGSLLVSYVRARGEALGVAFPNVGLMQRPERIVVLGASFIASPALAQAGLPRAAHAVLIGALVFLAIGTNVTALRRLRHMLRSLSPRPEPNRGLKAAPAVLAAAAAVDLAWSLAFVELAEVDLAIASIAGFIGAAGMWTAFDRPLLGALAPPRSTLRTLRLAFALVSSAALGAAWIALVRETLALGAVAAWASARVSVSIAWTVPLLRAQRRAAGAELDNSAQRLENALAAHAPHPFARWLDLGSRDRKTGILSARRRSHRLRDDLDPGGDA